MTLDRLRSSGVSAKSGKLWADDRVQLGKGDLDDRSDLELARAAVDDLAAFGELVRRHQDFVYGAAMRVVRNPAIAEEVAQDTFIRAFRGLSDFRGEAQVRSWLYRIATNLSLNVVTRRREYPSEALPEVAARDSPAKAAINAELRQHLTEAVAELPDSLRRPLVLREFEHLTYEEIAAELDIPLNTVRTRILRARHALRDKLEEWR
jgi:RNA polymerase sigma-70 factor (ECF subfamily)